MSNLLSAISVGALVGLASGYLGSLMVLRRMSLVGDALSHVALPGLALGLMFSFNPFLGAFGALILATVLIWVIENQTKLPTETLVGIFFTLSLAIGLLITPEPELLEALFGDISKTGATEAILAGALSLVAILAGHHIYHKLILGTISEDLAKSVRIPTKKMDFIFLVLVSLIVALGIKVVGTLLMGALVIIPAAAAKNFSKNLRAYANFSALFGLASAVLGIIIAYFTSFPPGPMVVLASALIFFSTLFFKRN
ncbi:MAG: metal ABC transporter permease [bacterium]|nr:metal ABC transporter permease [bacterium]